ncbi:MAG: hypothetical protein Q7U91_04995 [Sideroxyarcus sp.]|nr:hypothetical protein [Sideroxyarcus sp.]
MKKQWMVIIAALLLGACASYGGRGLNPGVASLDDVVRVMGQPAMRWQNEDSSTQLVYPRGPMGYHTFMVHIGADGKLQKIENVLDPKYFSRIQPGMTKDQVLHILGPSTPAWTIYFKARDELVWEWRYCDVSAVPARFHVLFDNSMGTVRSTLSITEDMMWPIPMGPANWCSSQVAFN